MSNMQVVGIYPTRGTKWGEEVCKKEADRGAHHGIIACPAGKKSRRMLDCLKYEPIGMEWDMN